MPLASLGPSYVGVLPDPCDWKKTNIIERSEMEKKVSDKGEDEKHKVGQKKGHAMMTQNKELTAFFFGSSSYSKPEGSSGLR